MRDKDSRNTRWNLRGRLRDFPTPELVTRSSDFNDVILLPHLGASTKEAEINCAVMAAEQISNFLKDGLIVNSVNFPSIKLGRKTENRMVIINKNEPGMIGASPNCEDCGRCATCENSNHCENCGKM